MSESRKPVLYISYVTLMVLLLYVASYGPAWSVIARTGNYGLLRFYDPLPQSLKTEYLTFWMKVDKEAARAARNPN
jgi:hypothetical protein